MYCDFSNARNPGRSYTVAQLNREIREVLERGYTNIVVEAEVLEASRPASGHVYFTLGDPGTKAQLRAVMWRTQAMRYGSRIVVGRGVRCVGRVTLYEARGSYQLVVDRIAEAGAGEKARMLAELKRRLAAEGLFDAERKRPLPPFPNCIGVVTSREGAAFRDILKVAGRRFPLRIILAHAQVQGEGAPREIARALDRLRTQTDVELVILGRGGGSSEDLDAFNAEVVVRSVASYPVPVVSAVGHEVDMTLVDLVADRRAATPSEAAEIAVPDGRALRERLAQDTDTLWNAMKRQVREAHSRLSIREGRLRSRDPRVRLRKGVEILSRSREALKRWPELVLQRAHSELKTLERDLRHWPKPALERERNRLGSLAANLEALSPLASLGRGYAVVRRVDDEAIVRSHREAPPGTDVDVTLAEGHLRCKVERAEPASESSKKTK